jgi:hypothetical protein
MGMSKIQNPHPSLLGCSSPGSMTIEKNDSNVNFNSTSWLCKNKNTGPSSSLSSSSPSSPSSLSEACRIRSRYLHRLGVTSFVIASSSDGLDNSSPSIRSCSHRVQEDPPILRSILLRSPGNSSSSDSLPGLERANSSLSTSTAGTSSLSYSSSSSPSYKPCKRTTRICFDEMVTIYTISSLLDSHVTPIERATLWISSTEAEEMILKNTIEFAAEKWDWRNAIEEEDFIATVVGDATGHTISEAVHPASVARQQVQSSSSSSSSTYHPKNEQYSNNQSLTTSSWCGSGGIISVHRQFCLVFWAQQQRAHLVQQQSQQRNRRRYQL